MQSNNYVVIQGWMCNELELKGNELLTFALIYGFSQDGQTRFYGSRNYIAETFNISLPTVDKALEGLENKNLIRRTLITDINGQHYEYEVYKETLQGVVKFLYGGSKETLQGGSKETLLNNTSRHTSRKKENNTYKETLLHESEKQSTSTFNFGKQKPKKDNLFTRCVSLVDGYTTDVNLRSALIDYLGVRLEIKDKPLYTNSWKGLLNKLDREFDASERLAVVRQSIERGYLSFYPVSNSGSAVRTESGTLHVPTMSEEDYAEEEKQMAELEAKGVQVRF